MPSYSGIGNDSIDGGNGNDLLSAVAGDNTLNGGYGNDVIYSGAGNDSIDGGTGDDTLRSSYSNAVMSYDTLNGSGSIASGLEIDTFINIESFNINTYNGNDFLIGGTGNDILSAGNGNNTLSGGDGNDNLTSGTGNDFIDGGNGNDTLGSFYSNAVLMSYDTLNGSGSIISGSEIDTFISIEAFNITSGNGNDFLLGGTGNDILNGDAGADTMSGGNNDDTYFVDDASDQVIENSGEGIDTVNSSIAYNLGSNVENLILTDTDNINGTGNDLDNIITGNYGNNLLGGGYGNDTVNGGVGADTMSGEKDDDTYFVDNAGDRVIENSDEGIDTINSSIAYNLGSNVENLILTGTNNINGTGNDLNNIITGNAGGNLLGGGYGDDAIGGGYGNDTLNGGGGADTMSGEKDDDTYFVDDAGDQVIENFNEGIDTVNSSIAYNLCSDVENLILTGTDNIDGIGNDLNNIITGNAGGNLLGGGYGDDTLNGGVGADTMSGEKDDDTYFVDDAGDQVIEYSNEGIDTVNSSITYNLGSDVENLVLTGTDNIDGTGNDLNNIITGNAGGNLLGGGYGDDAISGGYGNDTLNGGAGADAMSGGYDNDTYIVDNAGDRVIENLHEGIDTINSSITYSLGSDVENLILTGTDNINGTGNNLNNIVTGNAGSNRLGGGYGNDSINGGAGNDYIIGDKYDSIFAPEDGNDTIDGGDGNDSIVGGGGDDSLRGGSGNDYIYGEGGEGDANTKDTLDGGAGADRLYGGGNDDTIIGFVGADNVNGGTGNDSMILDGTSFDLNAATDSQIQSIEIISASTATASVSINLAKQLEGFTITGSDFNDTIVASKSASTINGGAGNDYLVGGNGNDTLNGGTGNDLLRDGAGDDRLLGGDGNDNLYGGDGADNLAGGAGNDVYYLSYGSDIANDAILEDVDSGTDTAYSILAVDALADNVENLILLGTAAINGTGNSLNNTIYGNAGNNSLDGGDGNDIIVGGAGDDSITGGIGNDILRDTLGNDTLVGGEGNDNFYAGEGTDSLVGGAGNDIYYLSYYAADGAEDVIVEAADGGTDGAYSVLTVNALAANVENLVLLGTEAINATGNSLDNIIYGNSGDNSLDGGDGNDRISGGAGNDSILGGSGHDVIGGAAGDDSITGGTGNDILRDTLGNDTLLGGEGDDNLYGGEGNDSLVGGAGNDVYYLALGTDTTNDSITEATDGGTDTAYSTLTVDTLAENVERLILLGTSDINATGNSDNNIIYGNGGYNSLDGGTGNDTLRDNIGNDMLTGGAGNDNLYGGTGTDSLVGGAGDDVYYLSYYASEGSNDVVVEVADAGYDTAYSVLAVAALDANVERLILLGTSDIKATGNDLNNTIYGNSGNNVITGGKGNDVLIGGTGIDTFVLNTPNNGIDYISDFAATEQLDISSFNLASFTLRVGAGTTTATASNQFIFNTTNGSLYFDADGASGSAAVKIATLRGVSSLTTDNFMNLNLPMG
jgi:trimeric autotransporter adhesin